MSEKFQKIVSAIILFSSLILITLIALSNRNNMVRLIILSLLLFASFGVRRLLIYPSTHRNLGKILILVDIFITFYINYVDVSDFSQIYFYLIVSDAVVTYFSKYCFIYIGIGYFSLLLTIYFKYIRWNYFDFWYLSPIIIETSFFFVFMIGMIYIAGYQINQNQILGKTMNELQEKSHELENANRKLHKTMESLEEIAALRERNRIAREIHDTIGHTLTTVSIEIEAGKRLAKKDLNLALEKFELAQAQVSKGLNDVRSSVRMLKDGKDILSFIPSIQTLINETEIHAGVSIQSTFSPIPYLNANHEKLLYRALQEGLTNGIRHGKCTEFILKLKYINNKVALTLIDNGKGCDNITLGFGLTAMKERVEEEGGSFSVTSTVGSGFRLEVEVPVEKEAVYEAY